MTRRFPSQISTNLGFEGAPLMYAAIGAAVLVGGIFIARTMNEDRKLENTKRHHPKGIGYTSINKQMDHFRNITKKVSPNIDENYYEYARKNKRYH